jgi:hypothetical protein
MSVSPFILVNNQRDFGDFAINRKQAEAQETCVFLVLGAFEERGGERKEIRMRQKWGEVAPLFRPIPEEFRRCTTDSVDVLKTNRRHESAVVRLLLVDCSPIGKKAVRV